MVISRGGPIDTIQTTAEQLGKIRLEAGKTGLVLGEDRHGKLVTVQMFRPQPTRVLAVGRLRFAQILAFRALALGAHISIQSIHPTEWNILARHGMEGSQDGRTHSFGLPERPQLTIVDGGSGVPTTAKPTDSAPWSSVLSVRTELTAWDVDTVNEADLILMQPLPLPQAQLTASTLNLPANQAPLFSNIRADLVTVISRGTLCWVKLTPTLVEYYLIGDPTKDK